LQRNGPNRAAGLPSTSQARNNFGNGDHLKVVHCRGQYLTAPAAGHGVCQGSPASHGSLTAPASAAAAAGCRQRPRPPPCCRRSGSSCRHVRGARTRRMGWATRTPASLKVACRGCGRAAGTPAPSLDHVKNRACARAPRADVDDAWGRDSRSVL
jgi:hypothetical protein